MAQSNKEVPKGKIKKSKGISKNLSVSQESSKHTKENQPKASLKRGKLPLNWNLYVDKQTKTGTSSKIKKYPGHITNTSVSQFATVVGSAREYGHVVMGPYTPAIMAPPAAVTTGRVIGIDCEMVGIEDGRENMLARVSLVDEFGSVVYDTFVQPQQKVTDYRTAVSGVRPADMINGKDFKTVQTEVYHHIHDKLLVGHAISNDLKVLHLSHPKKLIRDTSKFKKFREEVSGRTPSLRFLALQLLGITIQKGEHSSIEDARAAMKLYMKYRNSWESELRTRFYN